MTQGDAQWFLPQNAGVTSECVRPLHLGRNKYRIDSAVGALEQEWAHTACAEGSLIGRADNAVDAHCTRVDKIDAPIYQVGE